MRLINRILAMSEPAWQALCGTMKLCCAIAFCAFVVCIDTAPFSPVTYDMLLLTREMAALPAGLLLIAAIGTVCLEEAAEKASDK